MVRVCVLAGMVAAALTFTAASASADTYCVASPPTCFGGTAEPDLQTALDAAAANPGDDHIEVGAGTFDGPFTYDGSGGGNTVSINGADPDMTTLTTPGLVAGETVLTVGGDPGSSVASLGITLPAEDSDLGLALGPGGLAQDVDVSDQPGTTGSLGIQLDRSDYNGFPGQKATIHMHVGNANGTGSTAIDTNGGSEISDVSISGGVLSGIVATPILGDTDLSILRSDVTAVQPLELNGSIPEDLSAEVEDSVLRSTATTGTGAVVNVMNPDGPNVSFTGRHVTIEGEGPDGAGVQVNQFDSDSTGGTVSATLSNSIVGEGSSGPGHPLALQGEGFATPDNAARTTGTIEYSDADTTQDTSTAGTSTLTDSSHNIDQDPHFADAAGSDFHLQSGSPAIDAGSAALSGTSDTDDDSNPRNVQGASGSTCPNSGDGEPCPDMGAYEFQPPSGSPPALANIESSAASYQIGAAPVPVTGSLTVSDTESSTLSGATVKIASGYAHGDDLLGFSPQHGISGSFSNITGTLTLTGTASVADYQAVLRSITFSDGDTTTPSTATRSVSFQVDDGTATSNTVSRDVHVSPVPPAATTDPATVRDPSNLTLNGEVNPEGTDTHYHFQYGPDLDHMPNDVPSSAGFDAGSGTAAVSVAYPLSVTTGQQTCFRIVAVNSRNQTTYGGDSHGGKGLCVTTTAAAPPAPPSAPPGPFNPGLFVNLTGYTNAGEPAYPAPLTGPSIPQGVLTSGQEIFRGSNVTATLACEAPDVAACEIRIEGPRNTPFDKTTPFLGGAQRLPTDHDGEYYVLPEAVDGLGRTASANPWRYEVGEPPSSTQQTHEISGSLAVLAPLITGTLSSIGGTTSCPVSGSLPAGCFRTLDSPSGKPLVTIGSDGSIIAAGSGNIIAAGSGNLTAGQLGQIVAAGGANVVGAGSGNVARVLDAQGDVLAIIAAGSGNLRIIAAGSGNVLVNAAGQIVSAGSANVIAAQAAIVGAGSANIRDAGNGSIIAAGSGNLISKSGFAFANPALGLATQISTSAGLSQISLSTLGSKVFGAAARRHHASGTQIAGGSVTATRKGKAALLIELTRKGARLIAAAARHNAGRAGGHRRARLTLVVTDTYSSTYGKQIKVRRTIHVTPHMARHHHKKERS